MLACVTHIPTWQMQLTACVSARASLPTKGLRLRPVRQKCLDMDSGFTSEDTFSFCLHSEDECSVTESDSWNYACRRRFLSESEFKGAHSSRT